MEHLAWWRCKLFTEFWLGILKEKKHSKNVGIHRMIILQWIVGDRAEECGLDSSG